MSRKAPTPPPTPHAEVVTTQEELAKAFTEWERRFREEPERFQSEVARVLRETPESYGEAAAPYLVALLRGEV